MANFLLKFRNFRYLGNRGWCNTNFICIVKSTDPETLCFVQELGKYLVYKPSYSNFLLKFGKFSLPWQQGSSEQSLTDTIKLADPENPLLRACIWPVSPTQAKL